MEFFIVPIIPILFNEQSWIAVEKPHGLSVHNEEQNGNLLSILEQQLQKPKLFPIHRLDKETSGVQILAFDPISARELATKFQNKDVIKKYRALVRGLVSLPNGVWNTPLTDKAEGRNNPSGSAKDRVPCETQFRVLAKSKYFSHLELTLITGRQHQIRKHCALHRHAIVGDTRYGESKHCKMISAIYHTSRMLLHCHQITIDGNTIESAIPKEFTHLLTSQTK
jgi:tRNA pseudouridine65 synthase